ncbi:MAG TPA: hypothetical protein VER96_41360 [Polyangiaceae bacterium]|nr:hypothetical protein [Polyangiaceae bacterium]
MSLRGSSFALCAFLAGSGWVAPVRAAGPAMREYRVEFEAERVQVEGDLGSLELDGDVRVQAQRYRLMSQHLQLRRGPRGVEAEGTADVAFCTCDEPPIRLRVSHATLAPPTDALFMNPRLEVGGVPVLWLPALWLRAPTRMGLTLPRVAYRGDDGVFVGGGAYFPLKVEEGRVTRSLTLGGGGYLLKGGRLEGELDTESSTSRVAWDHVQHTALEVDAHGSAALSDATFAYRVDALRGARAASVSSSLEVSARRMDRARISVSHVDELALGFGVRADAPRAGPLGDLGAIGPELYLGAARGLGDSVSYDVFALSRTTAVSGSHSQTELFQRGSLSTKLRPGPLGVDLTAAESGDLRVAEYRTDGLLRGGLQARIGLPLLRGFGSVSHFVEPLIIARGLLDARPRGSQVNDERTLLGAGGFDTSVGQRSTRQALTLTVRAGALSHEDELQGVGLARLGADARWLGLAQSFAALGRSPAMVSLSRVRIGKSDGLHLLLRADGASHGSPARARVLFDESWFDSARPFLDRNGWSGGAELSIPWTRAFSTTGSIDYDLTERELLAAWGGFGYHHPCGCLAVASFVGHRVGRGGFDAWLGFDLAP